MTRPTASASQVRPRGGAGPEWLWWLIPAAFALVALVESAVYLGGRLASLLSGRGLTGPAWRLTGPDDVAHPATAWPGAPVALVWLCTVVIALAALTGVTAPAIVLVRAGRRGARPAARSLARRRDVTALDTRQAAATALRLRPTLADRHKRTRDVPTAQRGITLGRLQPGGRLLQASWEDVVLAVFAPRTGKTTSLAVPTILDAPGAVVACSNKADLYLATAALRATDTGAPVWLFDPQRITHSTQQWWWNPLAAAMTIDDATRLAGGFITGVSDDNREIWGPAATELLSNLIFAAHLAGRDLLQVYRWLFDEATEEPVRLLREHAHSAAADSLQGTQDLHPETRGSVYFTARAGCSSLRDSAISQWITPQHGLPQFQPTEFVETRGTLYLLSKNVAGGTSAAALVSALTTEVRVAAERAAERRGGRIDPPLVLVLDEVANICRIPDLPEQYSHLGSRSIVPIAILQSYDQGERVWGKAGMKELWGAATIKLIGSGADNADFAEDVSRVLGEHEITVVSYSHGAGGGSRSSSTRRERILTAADIRALPKRQAILLATGTRAALIQLLPWYTGPRKDAIEAAERAAAGELRQRATAAAAPTRQTP